MALANLLPLSPNEWRLMACIWELQTAIASQVAERLRTKLGEEVSPKTAGIFLARLKKKGYLRSAPGPTSAARGRPPYIYSPLVTREEALHRQLQKFLDDHLIDDENLGLLDTFLAESRRRFKPSTGDKPGVGNASTSPLTAPGLGESFPPADLPRPAAGAPG